MHLTCKIQLQSKLHHSNSKFHPLLLMIGHKPKTHVLTSLGGHGVVTGCCNVRNSQPDATRFIGIISDVWPVNSRVEVIIGLIKVGCWIVVEEQGQQWFRYDGLPFFHLSMCGVVMCACSEGIKFTGSSLEIVIRGLNVGCHFVHVGCGVLRRFKFILSAHLQELIHPGTGLVDFIEF